MVSSSLNPAVTSSINPNVRSSKNPNISTNILGLYVFDLNMNAIAFTVPVTDRVFLIFTPGCEFAAIGISARQDFWNIFDLNNEWVGFWVRARDTCFVRYDLSNNWIGFTT
jgi:hypothetical protein